MPERLWSLPPATFSAAAAAREHRRGFVGDHACLLLDEPTASLDAVNRAAVVALIAEKKRRGVAMLGIFHDEEDVRERVADRDRRRHPLRRTASRLRDFQMREATGKGSASVALAARRIVLADRETAGTVHVEHGVIVGIDEDRFDPHASTAATTC